MHTEETKAHRWVAQQTEKQSSYTHIFDAKRKEASRALLEKLKR